MEDLIKFTRELEVLIENGMSLKDVNMRSYKERESGRDIPYMSISQTAKIGGKLVVVGLWASPTKKQVRLHNFFNIKKDSNSVLTKYTLSVYLDQVPMVQFKEKAEKGFVLL